MVNTRSFTGRTLKKRVYELLESRNLEQAIEKLCLLSPRRVINPLFSFLYNKDQEIRWAAVTAMGAVVAKLADKDMEQARIIIRRLMWNLNDESGGIGWGSPEAMGEILARHEGLAREYTLVLISYTREDGNYLEHEMLQRGLLWGIGRLSQVRPHLVRNSVPYLMPYLSSNDNHVRGLTAWVMGLLKAEEAWPGIQELTDDENSFQILLDGKLIHTRVKEMAEQALTEIKGYNGEVQAG